ncbi:COX15/CtaA family protein [Skermanella stibiiresistens]|uniref:COX15/CtaA family protein n=1 Tax=Skermanella stibiiresistens TaxID=913326 RepID=UPI0012FC9670|nr:COX15/CtaA family protein [Skermanella stibiiresistens]
MSSVTYPASRNAAAPALDASRQRHARAIATWLLICCGMVFAMAVIGAVTRLTESGLSMVEWKPLIGILPPLTETEWNRVFDLYRETPEYRYVNAGMGLEEFKHIFFWEWFHRFWGQMIGFVFLLPFLWFWATKRIPKGLMPTLVGLFLLGGLQGGIGWFMVVSGLVDRPSVSHYRLALHLGVAFLIFALMLWVALGLLDPKPEGSRSAAAPALRRHAGLALGLVAVTAAWGAFVAGLDAGMIYNTWPLMGGQIIPSDMWFLNPAPLNFVENHAGVQFTHRWLAMVTGLVVLGLWWRAGKADIGPRGHRLGQAVGVMVVVQIALGIATLLTVVAIPLAAVHQAGALTLIALLVWFRHEVKRSRWTSQGS